MASAYSRVRLGRWAKWPRPLEAPSVGQRSEAILYGDTFSLIAELSIGLAGFSGVAAAFGGRERVFQPVERIRLTAVFVQAGSVFASCLAIYAVAAAGFSQASQFQVAGSIGVVVQVWMLAVPVIQAVRAAQDSSSTASPGIVALSALLIAISLGLHGFCVFQGGSPGPLVGALSIQLLLGFWQFTRLLTRPN